MRKDFEKGVVGVLFTDTARWYKEKPFKKNSNCKAYKIFAKKGYDKGVRVLFAFYNEYRKGGILRRSWEYDFSNNKWKRVLNQEVNIVYGRFNAAAFKDNKKNLHVENLKYKIAEDISVINHPELEEFCWDKRIVAEVFPEYSPKTFVVNTRKGLDTVISCINSDKVVVKPRFGTLGEGVMIVDKKDLPLKVLRNTLVQEFIDTSKGFEGISNGVHDLRIIIANGKIDHAHVREPIKEGVFTANMSLGGTRRFISKSLLPLSVLKIVKDVDHVLEKYYPRLYSIDIMFDENKRPFIVECNSSPVIKRYAYGKYKDPNFFCRMFDSMISGMKVKVAERY